ncbi:MAG TPA: hypothetical protein VLT35_04995 [Methanocella sp.]|nr:hypothetical protein [Methanocella sp.]
MEEWERRVAPGQSVEVFDRAARWEKGAIQEERKPAYLAGDGLPTLIP